MSEDRSGPSLIHRLGPAGPLALAAAVLPAVGGFTLLGFMPVVGEWFRSHEVVGVLLYVVGFAVFSGLALLPTWVQAALGGWAFGMAVGYPAALAGFAGGSIIGYAIARRAAGRNVSSVIDEHPKWRIVRDALIGSGFWKTLGLVTLVRIPFNSPFALMNLLMGSTRVNPVVYFVGTVVGMAPRTAVYVFIATGIESLSSQDVKSAIPKWMIVAGIVMTIAIVLFIGQIANKAVMKMMGANGASE